METSEVVREPPIVLPGRPLATDPPLKHRICWSSRTSTTAKSASRLGARHRGMPRHALEARARHHRWKWRSGGTTPQGSDATMPPMRVHSLPLRRASRSVLLAFALTLVILAASPTRAEQRTLEVRETAGIRRFGYPVAAFLELRESVSAATRFRLLHNGRPVEAQIRAIAGQDGRIVGATIDFEGSFLPLEVRRYTLEMGTDVPAAAEPAGGLSVRESADGFRVANGSQIEYLVPRKLESILGSVKTREREWIAPGGSGLWILARDGSRVRVGGEQVASRIVKEGPVSCGLHFERSNLGGALEGVTARLELETPRSKSWLRVDCAVEDPRGLVAGLHAELSLALGDGPTLLDFGAGSLVYAVLAKDQTAVLEAGQVSREAPSADTPAWKVLRGAETLEPYVTGPAPGKGAAPEGWAHVMDASRCTAVAVDEFAHGHADSIKVQASGRLEIARRFASATNDAQPGVKRLRFWLHFVSMPPHVGAVTSPQSMLAPLEAHWRE